MVACLTSDRLIHWSNAGANMKVDGPLRTRLEWNQNVVNLTQQCGLAVFSLPVIWLKWQWLWVKTVQIFLLVMTQYFSRKPYSKRTWGPVNECPVRSRLYSNWYSTLISTRTRIYNESRPDVYSGRPASRFAKLKCDGVNNGANMTKGAVKSTSIFFQAVRL